MNASATTAPQVRILVVDDERDNRELLAIVLRWDGFEVITAEGGEEALAIIAQQPPDLVLLDVMMPGMTGYQVVTRIRDGDATRHIPIIMVSAAANPNARALALSAGANDFLAKPVTRDELLSCVRTVLG